MASTKVAEGERRAPDTCDLRGTLPSRVSGRTRPLRLALVVTFLKHEMRSKLDGFVGGSVKSLVNYLQREMRSI